MKCLHTDVNGPRGEKEKRQRDCTSDYRIEIFTPDWRNWLHSGDADPTLTHSMGGDG